MGLFDKKKNQQNYIDLVRKTAEEALPEVCGWDMTLTTLESGALASLKKTTAYSLKYAGMNMAARLVGLRVHTSENPFAKTTFITCFKDSEIYFLSIGDGMSKTNLKIDPETCIHFTTAEIEGIKTSMGKKVTLLLRESGKFTFQYGVGAGTIYSLPEGDKKLQQFVKSFT